MRNIPWREWFWAAIILSSIGYFGFSFVTK